MVKPFSEAGATKQQRIGSTLEPPGRRNWQVVNYSKATHMREPPHHAWVRTAVLLGVGYAVVGVLFAFPATHVRAWRLAAWAVSAVGYAAHIVYERVRLQSSPGVAALHVAFGVALGAFALAVSANIHSLSVGSTSQHRQLLLLSLAIWPVITALPAFLLALGANVVAARLLASLQGRKR